MLQSVPCITTLTGASAAVAAIRALRLKALDVHALQDYYAGKTTRVNDHRDRAVRGPSFSLG